jgi:hypothetical protein
MSGEKYIGLDVHQATISVAVMDSKGKVVMESTLETRPKSTWMWTRQCFTPVPHVHAIESCCC